MSTQKDNSMAISHDHCFLPCFPTGPPMEAANSWVNTDVHVQTWAESVGGRDFLSVPVTHAQLLKSMWTSSLKAFCTPTQKQEATVASLS